MPFLPAAADRVVGFVSSVCSVQCKKCPVQLRTMNQERRLTATAAADKVVGLPDDRIGFVSSGHSVHCTECLVWLQAANQ